MRRLAVVGAAALGLIVPIGSGSASAAGSVHGPEIAPPTRAAGSYSARLVIRSRATARPGRGRIVARLGTETSWSRQPQSLLVLASRTVGGREWLKVLLSTRPTPSSGWISRDRVILRHSRTWIEVRKRNRVLKVFRNGRQVRRFRVVIGAAGTPTPAGLAAIYERNRQPDPHGFIGPWALSLTALSRTLKSYGGGPGRIALHGRDGASLLNPLGSAASHGCIRLHNRAIRWLAGHAPTGTPVRIHN